ncbi:MAG: hypothetical protein ACP5ER_06570 [Candidatus Bathyarchaeales archaeon]
MPKSEASSWTGQAVYSEEFHVKVAETAEEIKELLEAGFEYVLQRDGLAYFRKRK